MMSLLKWQDIRYIAIGRLELQAVVYFGELAGTN